MKPYGSTGLVRGGVVCTCCKGLSRARENEVARVDIEAGASEYPLDWDYYDCPDYDLAEQLEWDRYRGRITEDAYVAFWEGW